MPPRRPIFLTGSRLCIPRGAISRSVMPPAAQNHNVRQEILSYCSIVVYTCGLTVVTERLRYAVTPRCNYKHDTLRINLTGAHYQRRCSSARNVCSVPCQHLSVADPEERASGRSEWSMGAVPLAGMQGQSARWGSGAKSPRSWSIDAFCVMAKAFS